MRNGTNNLCQKNIVTGIERLIEEIGTNTEDEASIKLPMVLNLGKFLDSVRKTAGYFTYFGSFTTPGKYSIYKILK